MMKKNIYMRIGVLMLIAALATSGVFVGSGTYAKYIASATVEASARVAKFEVRYGAAAGADTSGYTTFSQIGAGEYAIGSVSLGTLYQADCATAHNANISAGSSTQSIIAPGCGGKIGFYFTNRSEVAVRFYLDKATTTATYGVKVVNGTNYQLVEGTGTGAEIEFAACDASGALPSSPVWGSLVNALGDASTSGKYIDLDPNTTTGTAATSRFVYWRWVFEDNQDGRDTNLGVAAATGAGDLTMVLTVKIKAQQLD